MGSKSTARTPIFRVATARIDVMAGLVSSTVAIPLAMAFGMFAFVTLDDEYFAYGVMAGFQNMAAVLLFLVQLGNVLGFEHNVRFTQVFAAMGEARPWSVLVAALTFAAMWNARRVTTKIPPVLIGLGCGMIAYYALV